MRPGRLIRSRADLLVGVGFAVAWLVEALIRDAGQPMRLALDLPGALFLMVLALRRRRPVLTMAVLAVVTTASSLLGWALGVPSGDAVVPVLALLVVVYSLGAHASRLGLLLGAPLALVPMVVSDLTSDGSMSNSLAAGLAFFAVFVVVLPALAGRLVRGRGRLLARLHEQERLLRAQRAAATEAALAEERIQLTGRLHEELLSGMERLAGEVANARTDADPEAAIRRIEDRARSLLARTRGVVVSLADDHPDAASGAPAAAPGGPVAMPVAMPVAAAGPDHSGALPWTALAAAAMCVGLMIEIRDLPVRVPMAVALLACLVLTAPIAVVWRRPLLVTSAVWAMAAGFSAVVMPLAGRFTAIGLTVLLPFLVAAFSGRRAAGLGLGVCVVGEALVFGLPALPGNGLLLLLSWVGGMVLAERGRLVGELRATTAQLAAGRAAALRSAVLQERARVARDLHDSTGHRLTVLALHATAARRMWETDRPRAQEALATIERVTAEGLAELRQGFADGTAEGDSVSLSGVVGLVDQARAAGLPVDLSLDVATESVPAAAGAAAYRVVQEALTNALRHAPGAAVAASVRCTPDLLAVEVLNGAASAPVPAATGHGGHGLAGMRHRVEACGGRLEWGARPEGGFAVRAELPLAVVPA